MRNSVTAGGTVEGEAGMKAMAEAVDRMAPLSRTSSSKKGKKKNSSDDDEKKTKNSAKKEKAEVADCLPNPCNFFRYTHMYTNKWIFISKIYMYIPGPLQVEDPNQQLKNDVDKKIKACLAMHVSLQCVSVRASFPDIFTWLCACMIMIARLKRLQKKAREAAASLAPVKDEQARLAACMSWGVSVRCSQVCQYVLSAG